MPCTIRVFNSNPSMLWPRKIRPGYVSFPLMRNLAPEIETRVRRRPSGGGAPWESAGATTAALRNVLRFIAPSCHAHCCVPRLLRAQGFDRVDRRCSVRRDVTCGSGGREQDDGNRGISERVHRADLEHKRYQKASWVGSGGPN